MMRFALALTIASATAAVAQTADQNARFLAALEAMEARTLAFYTSVDPRFEPMLLNTGDQDVYVASQECFIQRLITEGGTNELAEYIAAVEFVASQEITSLLELGSRIPNVMMTDLVFAASSDCGPMSHMTAAMTTPEFQELMDDPEVMQGLMGAQ